MTNYDKEQELNLPQQDTGHQFDLVYAIMDRLIDDRIESYGIINTICYLFDTGCTKEELLWLHFAPEDIDDAINYGREE